MKKVFCFICGILPIFLFSQTVTVSEKISVRDGCNYELIGKMKGHFLLFLQCGEETAIHAFDDSMKTKWKKELKFDRKKVKVLELISNKESFDLIYAYKKKGKHRVKIQRYNPGANLIDSLTIKTYKARFYPPKLRVIYSENREKILLYHNTNTREEFECLVFDLKQRKVLWEQKVIPRNMSFFKDFYTILLDNRGDVYLPLIKDNKKYKKEEHHFEIVKYDWQTNSIHQYRIPMEGKLTYDVQFSIDNLNKNLIAAGLYTNKSRVKANGYFFQRIPLDALGQYISTFEAFEDGFMATLLKKKKRKVKGLSDTRIQEIVHRRDGGILMIAELNKRYERRGGLSSGYMRSDVRDYIVDHHYDDIFVISIHPDGKTHWKNILHKRQFSQDDGAVYSSYFLLKTPKNLRFLFNDSIKYESTVSEYIINALGNMDRNSVMSTDNQKLQLRFRESLQTGADELLVPSEHHNQLKLVRIKY